MIIKIKTRTIAAALVAVVAALALATCGKVQSPAHNDAPKGSDGTSGSTCTWDQGMWDGCTFAP